VGPGEAVGLALERGVDLVVALFAVVKAGGVYIPLDPNYPPARLAAMLGKAKPRIVLTIRSLEARLALPTEMEVICLDSDHPQWSAVSDDDITSSVTPGDPLYVIFTSGSTGEPKGAVVQRQGFANLLEWFEAEFSFGPEDRVLLLSSPSFDLTQKNFFAPLRRGGTLVFYPPGPFDLTRLVGLIERHGITALNCTPSAFYPLVDPFDPVGADQLKTLRLAVLGGEPISVERVRPWLQSGTVEIANTYGPTECTDICGFYRLTSANIDEFPFVPIGGTIPNVQVAVVDEALAVLPQGEAGELLVGGAGVGLGYLGDHARTDERFVPNCLPEYLDGPKCYRTGDRVRLRPEGVLEFLGRVDHQVKLRGFRIELPEIEAVLSSHPAVREAVVVLRDEDLVAFQVPADLSASVSAESLRAFLGEYLPGHMVPHTIIALDHFPLTPNGKVDRLQLSRTSSSRSAMAAPLGGTSLEAAILGIWTEVLECPAGLDDNFFDLGGDSIQLAQVHAKVTAKLGRPLPVTDLFAHPTVRALARHLGQEESVSENSAIRQRAALQRQALASRSRPVRS